MAAVKDVFVTWGGANTTTTNTKYRMSRFQREREDVFIARSHTSHTDVEIELSGCIDARYEVNLGFWQVPGHNLRAYGHVFALEAKTTLLVLKRMRLDKNVATLIVFRLAQLHASAGLSPVCEICIKNV